MTLKSNDMEVRFGEKKVFEMIALQQPVTTDLRTIITIMKASSDLETYGRPCGVSSKIQQFA